MEVEGGNIARLAVFVRGKGIDGVGVAVWDWLGGLKGGIG